MESRTPLGKNISFFSANVASKRSTHGNKGKKHCRQLGSRLTSQIVAPKQVEFRKSSTSFHSKSQRLPQKREGEKRKIPHDYTSQWYHLQRTRRSERQFIQSHRISTYRLRRMKELFWEKDANFKESQVCPDSSDITSSDESDGNLSSGRGDDGKKPKRSSDSGKEADFQTKKLKCPPILKRRLRPRKVHDSPHIYVLDEFLTSTELDHLHKKIRDAERRHLFQKSFVDDSDDSSEEGCDNDAKKPKEGEEQKRKRRQRTQVRQRTSSFIHFPKMSDTKIASIENRAADILGLPNRCIEPLQLVRYLPGQHFGTHHDLGVYNEESGMVVLPKRSSLCPPRRIATLFVYLNDIPDNLLLDGGRAGSLSCKGGCTMFPNASLLEIQPKRGRAVLWSNIDPDGNPDPRTVHSGQPIMISHNPPDVSSAGEKSNVTIHKSAINDDFARPCPIMGQSSTGIKSESKSSLDSELSFEPNGNRRSETLEAKDKHFSSNFSRVSSSTYSFPPETEQFTSGSDEIKIPRKNRFVDVGSTCRSKNSSYNNRTFVSDEEISKENRVNVFDMKIPRKVSCQSALSDCAKSCAKMEIDGVPLQSKHAAVDDRHPNGQSQRKPDSVSPTPVDQMSSSYTPKKVLGNHIKPTAVENSAQDSSVGSLSGYESLCDTESEDDDEGHDLLWGFVCDLRRENKDPEKQCMIKGCKNKAVALWATTGTPQKTWYYCESCQETDFGGWPGPEDFHDSRLELVDGEFQLSHESGVSGHFDLARFLDPSKRGKVPPVVKYGINIWACEE